jgi:hypothetical protein
MRRVNVALIQRSKAAVYVTSALTPKADMIGNYPKVRFVPKADIAQLFDHIVSGQKNAIWYGDAKGFRGLEIDC